MHRLLLSRVLILGAVISIGHSLECYNCTSGVSSEHCEKTQNKMKCHVLADRCIFSRVQAHANHSTETIISKGCVTTQMCDSIKDQTEEACNDLRSTEANVTSCLVTCCSSDLCNDSRYKNVVNQAIKLMVSGVLALSCVIYATFQNA